MTSVALWTGRLPGLCPLPRKRTLWIVGGIAVLGLAGAFGLLGPEGPWLGVLASVAAGWTVWRHRWLGGLPRRLRPLEAPQGPDERAVRVEFRHDGALLGWDVGILWFEKGGVGFVGRTVSFVLPRAIMRIADAPTSLRSTLQAPQMTAKVFETVVGIVPLARELNAHMTLARIDALPDAITSETILPPSSMHPDLLQRGLAVRRRLPVVAGFAFFSVMLTPTVDLLYPLPHGPLSVVYSLVPFLAILTMLASGDPLPRAIRDRLPKGPRRRSGILL